MNCMKCGRELSDDGVFCAECLEEMEKYPIKPGVVIHLPRRKPEPVAKKALVRRKPLPSPEEQVKNLRKLVWRLIASLVVMVILLGATGYFTVVHLLESDIRLLPGQNYSAIGNIIPKETE